MRIPDVHLMGCRVVQKFARGASVANAMLVLCGISGTCSRAYKFKCSVFRLEELWPMQH